MSLRIGMRELRAKLAKGMGHNYYGERAWPKVTWKQSHRP